MIRLLKFLRQRREDKPGQSLVELALVGAILAVLLLGIIELVGLFGARSYLQDASRAGVRLGALAYNDSSINQAVMTTLVSHGMNTIHNGSCDIQTIEIYQSDPNGNPIAGPNSEDVYPLTPNFGTCTWGAASMMGWPPAARLVVVAPDQQTPLIGVRITYKYFLRTPVFRAFGTNIVMKYDSVLALGADNANNFLALASSTPVPTFTVTNTPTNTPTNTFTATVTNTPSVTATFTPTPTFHVGQSTWTVTPTSTITPTPSRTSTPTVTPTPTAPAVLNAQYTIKCDNSSHILAPPGIIISWSGSVPGASSYELHYFTSATGADATIATFPPIYVQYPSVTPPYFVPGQPANQPPLAFGDYWYVKVIMPSGSYSKALTQTIDAAHQCTTGS